MSDPRQLHREVVPQWSSIRAKFLFSNERRVGLPAEEPLSASQKYGVVPQSFLEEELDSRVMAALKGQESFKLVQPDDFVISLRSFQGGIEHSAHRGIISPAYTVMTPDPRAHPPFFRHYLKDQGFISRLNAVITGIRDGKTIKYEEFAQLDVPLPPLPTQRAIADFLDRKTAAIDGLIEKKQKLLALLAEKRAALINQAVTKGLDPTEPMKDSGIPWIGEIPAHWAFAACKLLFRIEDGTHDTPAYVTPGPNTFPLITSVCFKDGNIDFDNANHISDADHAEIIRRSLTEKGDVLMSMIGGNIGKSVLVNTDAMFSVKNVGLFKTTGKPLTGRLLRYVLESDLLKVALGLTSRGGAQAFLSLQNLRDLSFPVVPHEELTTIVEHLDELNRRERKSTAIVKQQIERLTEYRQALITAAVTGQLDIGEAA